MIKPKLICGPLLPTPMPIFSSVSGSPVCPSARRRRLIAPPSRTLSRPGFPNSVRALSLSLSAAQPRRWGAPPGPWPRRHRGSFLFSLRRCACTRQEGFLLDFLVLDMIFVLVFECIPMPCPHEQFFVSEIIICSEQ